MSQTPLTHLDPDHTSCIGGRTVMTCRTCAGHAPRGKDVCQTCYGRGFTLHICAHCNPSAAAAAAARASGTTGTTGSSNSNDNSNNRGSGTSAGMSSVQY